MKKFILLLFVMAVVAAPQFTQAQDDKAPKRPDDIGISNFDTFKNTSFNIVDESGKLKTDVTRLDTDIKGYVTAGLAAVSTEKLKGDLKSLRGSAKSTQTLTEQIGTLDEQGKQLVTDAKNVSPKLKAPAATSLTKKSISGLESSRKTLGEVSAVITPNIKLLTDELTKRGEKVEEE